MYLVCIEISVLVCNPNPKLLGTLGQPTIKITS